MSANRKLSLFFFCLIALILSACGGYRLGEGELCHSYSSICVPFVEGDREGRFTSALIRALASSGRLTYKTAGAELVLNVTLLPPESENIGFEYAPADKGDNFFSKIIVSDEARLSLIALIELRDVRTGMTLLGPFKIGRYLDYDFNPDLANVNDHRFSLGQLEMRPLAVEATLVSLYDLLAEKIVDYVIHAW